MCLFLSDKQRVACACRKDMVRLTCLDWRAVRPVYMVALKQQGAAIELILTGKTVVTAKSRMFSCCN